MTLILGQGHPNLYALEDLDTDYFWSKRFNCSVKIVWLLPMFKFETCANIDRRTVAGGLVLLAHLVTHISTFNHEYKPKFSEIILLHFFDCHVSYVTSVTLGRSMFMFKKSWKFYFSEKTISVLYSLMNNVFNHMSFFALPVFSSTRFDLTFLPIFFLLFLRHVSYENVRVNSTKL